MELSAANQRRAEALALFYKGRRLEQEVDDDLALEAYRQAMQREPENVSLASRMARLMANMGKYNEALTMLEATVAAHDRDPSAWITLSRHCLQHHHGAAEIKSKALQFARQTVEKFPLSAEAYRHLVDTYFFLTDLPGPKPAERAREVMERAAQAASTDAHFWLALLPAASKTYPLDDAATRDANLALILHFAEQAQRFAQDQTEVLEPLASFYLNQAKRLKSVTLVRKALPLLEKITTRHPENLPARHTYAATLRQAGEEAQATRIYRDLVRINAQDLVAHRALIRSAEISKDLPLEIEHRLAVLHLEGGEPQEWLDVNAKMLASPQAAEAPALLLRAMHTHPEDARLPYHLALDRQQLEQWPEALQAFQKALLLTSQFTQPNLHTPNLELLKDPDFFFHGAELAAQQPFAHELALEWYRQSLKLSPDDQPLLQARCYHGLGTLLQDEDFLRKARDLSSPSKP